jgi:hypothetical protein
MNSDLMMAVLSMEAYNAAPDSAIGNAEPVYSQSPQADGFAAVAYTYNGGLVISYRGTDDWADVLTGSSGGNFPLTLEVGLAGDAAIKPLQSLGVLNSQSVDAVNFYKSAILAAGLNPPNLYSVPVTFTGHSLGGGLAGLMDSL